MFIANENRYCADNENENKFYLIANNMILASVVPSD